MANASEEDDFIYTVTVEGSGSEQVRESDGGGGRIGAGERE